MTWRKPDVGFLHYKEIARSANMKVELGLWLHMLITKSHVDEHVKAESLYESETYSDSLWEWETCPRKFSAYALVEKYITKDQDILDVGCACGTTSFVLGRNGWDSTACDFDGDRLRRIASLDIKTVAYGNEVAASWVLAFDVIEHVPNPIAFVRWLHNLCTVGAILTFPLNIEWKPPYEDVDVHNYVDWSLLRPAVETLFTIVHEKEVDGGMELVLLRNAKKENENVD